MALLWLCGYIFFFSNKCIHRKENHMLGFLVKYSTSHTNTQAFMHVFTLICVEWFLYTCVYYFFLLLFLLLLFRIVFFFNSFCLFIFFVLLLFQFVKYIFGLLVNYQLAHFRRKFNTFSLAQAIRLLYMAARYCLISVFMSFSLCSI